MKGRKLRGKTLLDLLLTHYDELERLLALTSER